MPKFEGWLLPDVVDPPRLSVCVPVPDDPNHRRAFIGALWELTWSKNWQGDEVHTAAQVSRVWSEIFQQVVSRLDNQEVCDVPAIIDSRVDECNLQMQFADNPGVWVTIGRVQTPEPACAFENTVEVGNGDNTEFEALALYNVDPESADGHGVHAGFYAFDSSAVLSRLARVFARWHSTSSRTSSIQVEALQAGLNQLLARFGNGIALQVFAGAELGLSQGLRVTRSSGVLDTSTLLNVTNSPYVLHTISSNGFAYHQRLNDSAAAAPAAVQVASRSVGVTPSAGFGSSLRFTASTTTQTDADQAEIISAWSNPAHAAREARLTLRSRDWSGWYNGLTIGAADSAAIIGFLGKGPIPRQVVNETTEIGQIERLSEVLEDFGLITNNSIITPDGDVIQEYLGDRNVPPESVNEECLAANWVAGELYAHIADAFSVTDYTTQGVYDHFRLAHGWDLQDLYVFSNNVVAQTVPGGAAILAEIVASYADFVPAILDNLYDPDEIATWTLSYSGYGAGTRAVLPWLLRAFSRPTWLELLYTGSLFGVENFSCDSCNLTPWIGEWAVEWETDNTDWVQGSCGEGWSTELNCPPGDVSVDLQFTIPGPAATEFHLVYAEVEVSYNISNDKQFFCFVTTVDGSFTMSIPPEFDGSGTYTFTAVSGGALPDTGSAISVGVLSSETPDIGDIVTITKIRIEGDGAVFEHNGEC